MDEELIDIGRRPPSALESTRRKCAILFDMLADRAGDLDVILHCHVDSLLGVSTATMVSDFGGLRLAVGGYDSNAGPSTTRSGTLIELVRVGEPNERQNLTPTEASIKRSEP